METYYCYSYTQSIYYPADVCSTAGVIQQISWYYNGGSTAATFDETIVIYMGHTTKTTFSSTADWVLSSGLTEVYNGTITLDQTPHWITVDLDTPFAYNGTDNLVIAVDRNTGTWIIGSLAEFYAQAVTGNRSLEYHSDVTNPSPSSPPTGTNRTYLPNIIFDY